MLDFNKVKCDEPMEDLLEFNSIYSINNIETIELEKNFSNFFL